MEHAAEPAWEPDPDHDEGYALFAKEARVVVDDGTPVAYTFRNREGARVPVLFANGWSCSDAYWAGLLPELEARGHPCVLPDTRGHGRSGLPRPPGRGAANLTVDDVSMSRVARDLVACLDDAGVERAVVVGHSMGTQTALEVYRQIPDRVAGLVLIAGTYENPAKTFYGTSVGDLLFPIGQQVMRWFPEVLKPIWATIGPAGFGHWAAQLVRAAGTKTTPEALHPYLLHLKSTDPSVMVLMAAAMRAHSAADLLPTLTAPTLVVAAGADVFTPARCSEAMHHLIPDSELVTFPQGAHTLPVEEPEAIAAAIDEFVRRRVDGEAAGPEHPEPSGAPAGRLPRPGEEPPGTLSHPEPAGAAASEEAEEDTERERLAAEAADAAARAVAEADRPAEPSTAAAAARVVAEDLTATRSGDAPEGVEVSTAPAAPGRAAAGKKAATRRAPAPKRATAKRTPARKASAKKASAKEAASEKSRSKKATATKATAKAASARKAAARKASSTTRAARKSPASKATTEKAATRAAAKKATPKKASSTTRAAKKSPARKATARKATAKPATKRATTTTSGARKAVARKGSGSGRGARRPAS